MDVDKVSQVLVETVNVRVVVCEGAVDCPPTKYTVSESLSKVHTPEPRIPAHVDGRAVRFSHVEDGAS